MGADHAVLVVDAHTTGDTQAYFDVIAGSPLGAVVGGRLAQAWTRGGMQVPLTLSIPLSDTVHISVRLLSLQSLTRLVTL